MNFHAKDSCILSNGKDSQKIDWPLYKIKFVGKILTIGVFGAIEPAAIDC